MDCRAFNTSSVASGFVSLEHFRPMHPVAPFSLADANDRRSALRDAALSRRAPPVAPSPTVVGGPRVRILLPPESPLRTLTFGPTPIPRSPNSSVLACAAPAERQRFVAWALWRELLSRKARHPKLGPVPAGEPTERIGSGDGNQQRGMAYQTSCALPPTHILYRACRGDRGVICSPRSYSFQRRPRAPLQGVTGIAENAALRVCQSGFVV